MNGGQKIMQLQLKNLLPKCTGCEHFSHEVDVPISSIDPRSVELHNVSVLQCFQEMNFTVKPFKIFRALQEIIQLDLVPSNFNPLILIECSISASIKNPNHTHKKKKSNLSDALFYKMKEKHTETQFLSKSVLGQTYNKLEEPKRVQI